ncbi:antitoxin [Prauserella sp. PE36]|uniref:Antitoxin n=2 Tax=Prauserella TaxID=142577 RepID=A0A318LM02_9PSEU|nr:MULTISPECIES: CopG family transcriptional regulator [Prauserella]PXY30607.1 antitoxin [Prauserella flavalba]PXY33011.1 antitoxin [Prauserella coralliicola]RBM16432.1 antitoxin [Prauserella sp. PE36]TKG69574.1 antitoxin [Prauserella endophytica]
MRTTITLDPDVEALVRKLMAERGLSFKEAVNSALRSALGTPARERFHTPTFAMGGPTVPLDHALRVAADLEDAELQRKLATGR